MPCCWRYGDHSESCGPEHGIVLVGKVIIEQDEPVTLMVVLMHMLTNGDVLTPFAMVVIGGQTWPLLGAGQTDLVPEVRGRTFPVGQPDHVALMPGDDLVEAGDQRRGHDFAKAFADDELEVRPCLVHAYVVDVED